MLIWPRAQGASATDLLNKVAKGFNVAADDAGISCEICFLVEELGELARSHRCGHREGVIDRITDLVGYCLGPYEILEVDDDKEMERVLADIESKPVCRLRQ